MTWSARQRSILRELGLGAVLPPLLPGPVAGAAAMAEAADDVDAQRQRAVPDQRDPADGTLPGNPGIPAAAASQAPAAPVAVPSSRPSEPVSARAHTREPDVRPASPRGATTAPARMPSTRANPDAGATPASVPTERVDAARIARLDWEALREEVRTCEACGLARTRTQTVFGVGSHAAHWMIVGEAPGESEDKLGDPFVGLAGKLLDRMLAALDLTRASADADGTPTAPERAVYIANTIKCRPPGNRNPAPQELQSCAPFLARQIALVQPRVILAMGRFAAARMLGSDAPLGRLRGQVYRAGAIPVVVTYHPAYLLRNPIDKARAWEDLCLAADVAQAGPVDAAGSDTHGAAPAAHE